MYMNYLGAPLCLETLNILIWSYLKVSNECDIILSRHVIIVVGTGVGALKPLSSGETEKSNGNRDTEWGTEK